MQYNLAQFHCTHYEISLLPFWSLVLLLRLFSSFHAYSHFFVFFLFIVYCVCFLKFQFKLNKCEYVRSCVCVCVWVWEISWVCVQWWLWVCVCECVNVLVCLIAAAVSIQVAKEIDRSNDLSNYLSLSDSHSFLLSVVSCFSFATL